MSVRRILVMLMGGAALGGVLHAGAAEPGEAGKNGLDPGAQLPLAETHEVTRLSPTHLRRLFVLDTMFPAAEAARTYVLDGTSGKLEGMFNQAYWPNFAVAPDGKELYAVDSYWEKHTRGKRSDYLVIRDAQTFAVKDDVPLPEGRLLVVSKKYNFDVTPDGHYGLTYNLAPVTEVTVTDLKAHKSVGSIPVPGCGLIFAQAPQRFSSLCADGSMITVTFDEQAHGTTERAEHVFDAVKDPAFEHSAWDKARQRLYLITYHGTVVPVSLAGAVPAPGRSWSLASAAERTAGWLPGGWQMSAVHSKRHEIYVLMHRGHDWTHKHSGHEVWVFDADKGERLRRISLSEPAQSLDVSQDEDPLVYVITDSNKVAAYQAVSGRRLYAVGPIGFTPQLLSVWGE